MFKATSEKSTARNGNKLNLVLTSSFTRISVTARETLAWTDEQ